MPSKKSPLISVVMLNYNGLKYLKKTIPPILKLDYSNYEFIIVDNGSTDGSIDFIKKFKKIKLVENGENLGYSKGKNIGVIRAKGEYVLLLDGDILIQNYTILDNLLSYCKENISFIQVPLLDIDKENTFYYGVYFSIYGSNMHRQTINIKRILNYKENIINIGSSTGGCCFFNKRNWHKIGGLDESQKFNIDDTDIGPRAIIYGFNNILYTKTYFIHLGINKVDSSEDYSNRFKLMFSGHARSMIKNYRLKNLFVRFPLLCLFQLTKAIRYSIKKRSGKVLLAFFYSLKIFLKNLQDTLKQRKIIQSKRVVKDDIFLKIKPPKFD